MLGLAGLAGVAALGAALVSGLFGGPTTAPVAHAAGGPPQFATANVTALVGPQGGAISGFGITATFAPGAVSETKLIILGNWPNGLDVPAPSGERIVKTFSLQQCNADGSNCTSAFGDFADAKGVPASPAGTEKIAGSEYAFTSFQNVKWTGPTSKLVTITINTGGDKVFIYNPNATTTAQAYPVLLPSTVADGTLTFQTFRPIVWVVTTPTGD